jgi:hypothetical protein
VATRKWSGKVKTVSTKPPKGLFTKDAETIARIMARRSVSPKGSGSGVRMIQFFINRAGRTLSAARRRELEKAKNILQQRKVKSERDLTRGRKRISARRGSRARRRGTLKARSTAIGILRAPATRTGLAGLAAAATVSSWS